MLLVEVTVNVCQAALWEVNMVLNQNKLAQLPEISICESRPQIQVAVIQENTKTNPNGDYIQNYTFLIYVEP